MHVSAEPAPASCKGSVAATVPCGCRRRQVPAAKEPSLRSSIAIDCPVRLLQGQCDTDVPWEIALRTADRLRSSDVQTLLIKDGDHRLSRDGDIALLIRTVAALLDNR